MRDQLPLLYPDTEQEVENIKSNVQGKTIKTIEDAKPILRIIFTDTSYLEIEAVACGDLRFSYQPNTAP